jgi:hypothetical protein
MKDYASQVQNLGSANSLGIMGTGQFGKSLEVNLVVNTIRTA